MINIHHSIRMIVINKLVLFSLLTNVHSLVGRCYLCSEDTLAECIGSTQSDSPIYTNVLQYYTEPCNGQCVLFRDENHWTIRGCSWTYGHMKSKSTGWHDISPGIKAYFCNSHLCNNGTYEQMQKLTMKTELFRISPQELFLLAGHNSWRIQARQLRQCYVCTARFQGCGEFLDPHYASRYIRSCPTSCIIFRNPLDLNLITRDCSFFWPQVHAKTGLHKLFGTDAYFCQGSLCNGISFDFITGIFHNRLSPVITLPPIRLNETTSTTNDNVSIETTTLTISDNTTDIEIDNSTLTISDNSTDIEIDNSTWTILDNSTNIEIDNSTLTISDNSTDIEIDNSTLNTSSGTDLVTTFEHLSVDEDDIFASSTPIINFPPLIPYYFLKNQTKDKLFESIKPWIIPPFSWMLNMAAQSQSTSATTLTTPQISYDYCKNKQCYYGGRLNSDCLCICLPTFTGDNCEKALCDEEPIDICAFMLEHECQINHNRYLCPNFCQLDICLPNQT